MGYSGLLTYLQGPPDSSNMVAEMQDLLLNYFDDGPDFASFIGTHPMSKELRGEDGLCCLSFVCLSEAL